MQTQKPAHERAQEMKAVSAWLVKRIADCAQIEPSQVDVYASFASYGLSSMDIFSISGELEEWLGQKLQPTLLYNYPTIDLLARALVDSAPTSSSAVVETPSPRRQAVATHDIAVIGMAGRFPGASNVDEFWQNLRGGIESITVFSSEELIAAGNDAEAIQHPAYVRARPVLKAEEVECFDAAFFGYSPREAAITDPQHRVLLECAWEALERAGYEPGSYNGLIGVYAGCNLSTYLLALAGTDDIRGLDDYQIVIGHDKDSLTNTVSYKLNLRGPSVVVQSFCSTSLVAVYLACQGLMHGECDMALAGGVSIRVPSKIGYRYSEGGMESSDGHCRAFDSKATGTLFGDGAGVVVLKRLQDALRDGDSIDAVIKGTAINNDGSFKVSYTAPSIVGQSAAIMHALQQAGVDASTLGYVEAHGSATTLGDPIEVTALTQAFRQYTHRRNYCALGSVKSNIGHMDRAAGVAGLIKTIQALKHKEIPPTLHVETPNPRLELEQSPFFLNTRLIPWSDELGPRRASVNSLGLGGTNAHVVLEEAPTLPETSASRPWQLLMLSARTQTALEEATRNLGSYLQEHEQASLADVAFTLQVGRKRFEHRRFLLCRDREDALRLLSNTQSSRVFDRVQRHTSSQAIFLFPGEGEQYPQMTWELYQQEPFFRKEVDRCCQMLHLLLGLDLRAALYPEADAAEAESLVSSPVYIDQEAAIQQNLRALLRRNASRRAPENVSLDRTELAQPAIFVIEYALARLLMHWGVKPQAMLGYGLGEYVAATLAGVLSLEDALMLVARRARFIAAQPSGAMISVALSETEARAYLRQHPQLDLDLAIVAAPQSCVLAGPVEAVRQIEQCLQHDTIACYRIEASCTSHALHSRLLAPAKKQLTQIVRGMLLCPPTIPYISNMTGTWITDEQATNPEYWAGHMCETVRFADGVECLLRTTPHVFVEVGVGQTLGALVRQHPACDRERMTKIIATQPSRDEKDDYAYFLTSIGRLWLIGVELDWQSFYAGELRRRIPLPTYPFERQRHWIDVQDWRQRSSIGRDKSGPYSVQGILQASERKADIGRWFAVPCWKQAPPSPLPPGELTTATNWLIFLDEAGIGAALARRFVAAGQRVVTVAPGTSFVAADTTISLAPYHEPASQCAAHYQIDPRRQFDYRLLLQELTTRQLLPTRILHGWSISDTAQESSQNDAVQQQLDMGFHSLLALAQALGEFRLEHCTISLLSNGIYDVLGQEGLSPAKATLLGPCRVIPQEYAELDCHLIEVTLPDPTATGAKEALLEQLVRELTGEPVEKIVVLRGNRRWLPTFEEIPIPVPVSSQHGLREHGVYLITGGLGEIGLAVAQFLATTVQARLVLTSRHGLPPRDSWSELLHTLEEESLTRKRINAVLAMERQGAQVLIIAADVTDQAQMQQVIEQTHSTFGELNGVLHLAGVAGTGPMHFKSMEAAAAVLAPKVQGTLVLERVLQGVPLEFLLLFSSITTLIGGPGQVDYCAANVFLDVYARSQRRDYPVLAIDWSAWQSNAGALGLAKCDWSTHASFESNRRELGISLKEGVAVLQRLLTVAFPQIIVCPQDIQALAALSASRAVHSSLRGQQDSADQPATRPRPPLKNSYIAPGNDDERKMVRIWEGLLGIEGIGVHDSFFDLGGNLLLGMSLLIQVRKEFNLAQLPAYVLSQAPNVAAMVQYITQERQEMALGAIDERSLKRQSLMKKRVREKSA